MSGNQDQPCETVKSTRGGDKLVVTGFLFTLDKTRDNIVHYWHCDQKRKFKCKVTAQTELTDGQHFLTGTSGEHTHEAIASRVSLLKACNQLKEAAKTTNDKPAIIMQITKSQVSQDIAAILPTSNAQRKQIKRQRKKKDAPVEPKTLEDFILPDSFKYSISGEMFVRQIDNGPDKILLFVTVNNLKLMSHAAFWIMDGTFKVAPNLFRQLYTIHAPVGNVDCQRILPLAYALMTRKSLDLYTQLFEELNSLAGEQRIDLQPDFVLTDFEIGSMNAIRNVFPGVRNKACHFHLGQSIYRRLQQIEGLQVRYSTDEPFSLIVRHLSALAFLPDHEVENAFNQVKALFPQEAIELVTWFEENYAIGRLNRRRRNVRLEPMFPPAMWTVWDNMELGLPRTQNKVGTYIFCLI
jgi:hypothetical protein